MSSTTLDRPITMMTHVSPTEALPAAATEALVARFFLRWLIQLFHQTKNLILLLNVLQFCYSEVVL